MSVAGLVAAAGRSSRMGKCKALLHDEHGVPFVVRCVRALLQGGVSPVVVALPEGDDGVRVASLVAALHVVTVQNTRPALGLSGSIAAALDVLGATAIDGLVVWPVDTPFADASLVRQLVAAIAQGEVGAAAAVPVVVDADRGPRRGHPVAFAPECFGALAAHADDGGPRRVLDELGSLAIDVEANDPRVADDVDTPDDYARLIRAAR